MLCSLNGLHIVFCCSPVRECVRACVRACEGESEREREREKVREQGREQEFRGIQERKWLKEKTKRERDHERALQKQRVKRREKKEQTHKKVGGVYAGVLPRKVLAGEDERSFPERAI
jgi:hypothetical protein